MKQNDDDGIVAQSAAASSTADARVEELASQVKELLQVVNNLKSRGDQVYHVDPWQSPQTGQRPAQEEQSRHSHEEWWSQDSWRTSWDNSGWGQRSQSDHNWKWKSNWQSKDFKPPPTWPGWEHFRLWAPAIQRWSVATDTELEKQGTAVHDALPWELQAKLKMTTKTLTERDGLTKLMERLWQLTGETEGDQMRRVIRRAIFEWEREPKESLTQFVMRKDRDWQDAEEQFQVQLPSKVKAIMLEDGARLGEQGYQNLRTLTAGEADVDKVTKALRAIDPGSEALGKRDKKSSYGEWEMEESAVFEMEADSEESDAESISSDMRQEVMAVLTEMDLNENQVHQAIDTLIGEKVKKKTKT